MISQDDKLSVIACNLQEQIMLLQKKIDVLEIRVGLLELIEERNRKVL